VRKEEASRSHRSTPEELSKSDNDRKLEEDLRNRLLYRRNQKDYKEPHSGRKDDFYDRKDKHRSSGDYHAKERREPEEFHEHKKHRSHRPVDSEAEARRKKFLEADRDEMKRKERARQELEARREQHRQKETREVSISPEPEKKKKRYESSEERQAPADDVVMLSSEQSHGEEEDEAGAEEIDSESDSHSSKHSKESEEFEMSPIPVEQLEKSERKNSRSKSRSPTKSRSRSKSKSRESQSSTSSRSSSRSTNSQSDSETGSDASESRKSEEKEKPKIEEPVREEPAPEVEERKAVEEEELPPYFPALQGCRSVEEFQCLNRIEEGTYGVVYRARDKRTDEVVALKRLKMEKEKEGFPITSLREINTLLKGQHPNIVTVREIVVGSNMDKFFIVMDYVEHDLKSLIETMKHKKQVFLPGEVKCLIQQLIRAVAHLHDNWILHRDLKTSNLLLSHKGILKVGDFGLAREYGSPLKEYTSIVVTLWYRAPELLLGCKEYSCPIDVWSVGCIFAELLAMTALFPGKSEVDQLNRIFKDLGTPNERIWPGYDQLPLVKKMTFTDYPVSHLRKKFATLTSELGLSLLQGLLTYDPKQRLTAEAALKNNYFKVLLNPFYHKFC
jgi:cell division cycle 2-like protein